MAAERVEVMHFWLYSTEMLVMTASINGMGYVCIIKLCVFASL